MSELKPGRELDALIAEKVMGFELCKCADEDIKKWRDDYCAENAGSIGFYVKRPARFGSSKTCNRCGFYYAPCLEYSTSIDAAWEIVEKLQSDKKYVRGFHITDDPHSSISSWAEHDGKYFAGFCLGEGMECAAGESAPHAISLAALKAVGYVFEEKEK